MNVQSRWQDENSKNPPPTNNGCYAWQDERQEITQWQSGQVTQRERQLGQLFNAVNLQPQQRAAQSNMENLVQVIAGMFQQCGIRSQLETVEYQPRHIAFIFRTYTNMLSDNGAVACQFIRENLEDQIQKTITTGVKPFGQQFEIIVWVEK